MKESLEKAITSTKFVLQGCRAHDQLQQLIMFLYTNNKYFTIEKIPFVWYLQKSQLFSNISDKICVISVH